MTVQRPRAKKPSSVDEIGRVLRIYDLILSEYAARQPSNANLYIPTPKEDTILEVADRIAARTED